MKKTILLLSAMLLLSAFQGYAATSESPPYDPNPGQAAPAYDANAMTEVKFKIVDANGVPVSNLCVNLEYKSGREGSYMPGDALTKSDGIVTRSAHPNATYTVLVTDRKMLDYKGASLRNQMKFTITVKENAKNKYLLVWTKPTPNELDIAAKGKVTLEFLDKDGKPVQDLWVSMHPADDKEPEPRQIVPGITDKDGKVYWTVPETGKFTMGALFYTNDDQVLERSEQYTFTVKKFDSKFTFQWKPKQKAA